MMIIDEILPKVKAEVRLDKDNKTLWIKTDTLDGYDRIIIEDGSVWCRIFYEDCGECAHNKSEQTEPSNSEIPNNCEPQTIRCPKCGRTDYIRDMEKDMGIKGSHYKYKCINCNTYIKDEPTISKMEQVDKDINVRSKDEPTTQTETQNSNLTFEKADEPQTDCAWK